MKYSEHRTALIQDFTPPWTQNIAYSKEWQEALHHVLPLEHIRLKEYRGAPLKESSGGKGQNQEQNYDALYLSSSIPSNVHDFIPLFNQLAPGAIMLLEWESKRWSSSEMKKISSSLGADLIFFGSANSYDFHFRSANKIAVLQKRVFLNEKKKVSILIPILSAIQGNPRVLEWLQFFAVMDLLPFVELLLIFDGIHDALPAWQECEALEEERGFQMLRHYRSFGKAKCMRSAFYFARGRYLLWDDHSLPCFEFFSIFDLLPKGNAQSPLGVFAKAWGSDSKSAKGLYPAFPVSFFLLNRSAAKILRHQYDYKQNTYKSDCAAEERELLNYIQSTLKKAKAKISYASLTAHPSSSA